MPYEKLGPWPGNPTVSETNFANNTESGIEEVHADLEAHTDDTTSHFTAGDRTKLSGIEAGAEVNPTAAETLTTLNSATGSIDADLLGNIDLSPYATITALDDHTGATDDRHGAAHISVADALDNFTGDNVEDVLEELSSLVGVNITVQEDGVPEGTATTINFGNNLNTSVSGGVATVSADAPAFTSDKVAKSIGLHTVGSNQVWTDMPAALTEIRGVDAFRTATDLTKAKEVRLVGRIKVAGSASAELRVQYATTFGESPTWNYLDGATGPGINISSTGVVKGSWVAIAAGAKADVQLRLVGINGDGAVDPSIGNVWLQVREEGISTDSSIYTFEGPLNDLVTPFTSDPTGSILKKGTITSIVANLNHTSDSGSVVVEVYKVNAVATPGTDTLVGTVTIPAASGTVQLGSLSFATDVLDRYRFKITSKGLNATDLQVGLVMDR